MYFPLAVLSTGPYRLACDVHHQGSDPPANVSAWPRDYARAADARLDGASALRRAGGDTARQLPLCRERRHPGSVDTKDDWRHVRADADSEAAREAEER